MCKINQNCYRVKPGKNHVRYETGPRGNPIKISMRPGAVFVPSNSELALFGYRLEMIVSEPTLPHSSIQEQKLELEPIIEKKKPGRPKKIEQIEDI